MMKFTVLSAIVLFFVLFLQRYGCITDIDRAFGFCRCLCGGIPGYVCGGSRQGQKRQYHTGRFGQGHRRMPPAQG